MNSPPHLRVSEREMSMHRLVSPTARIFSATVILITGMGISAIFWKMPKGGENHALCHAGIIDQGLAATPLPSETVAILSPEEREGMTLPKLDYTPVADNVIEQYAQVYAPPVSLAARSSDLPKIDTVSAKGESALVPIAPKKFEPMRQIIEEKPISVEPVNREFQSKPNSVSTVEKSDEMLSRFHFAANRRADSERLSEPESPMDPFAIAVHASTLQPLQSLQLETLSPLLPLKNTDLQSIPVLVTQ